MSTLTPNYGLHLPENTDSMDDFFANYESDMKNIDDHLGSGGGATIEEMTQAEYEALPDTKKTDGILRGLKDVKSFLDADILYLGTCYSTSERMVGCWISGKPLYQKTINFGSLNAGQGKSVAHGIADIETIVNYNGIGYNTVENRWNTLPRVDDDVTYQRGIAISLTNIVIWGAGNTQAMNNVYVTIWYTKTTDAAGSGTWTPSGVNAIHYDTNEQIIGTFLGKTLYQRTWDFSATGILISYNAWTDTSIDSTNMESIVSVKATHPDGTCYEGIMADPTRQSHTVVGLQTTRNGNDARLQYVTLQYTKSS